MRIHGDQRGRDFSGKDLAGSEFEGADLYCASFDSANLTGAVFLNCFAAEASFKQANCAGLRAIKTNFYRSDFSGADLSDALLWKCVLASADLRGATLRRLTMTLDCNSYEELRLDRSASTELAYLFGRARTPHRQGWLDVLGEHDLARLAHVFEH
jgi:uncharacterized protein YjbI with pentapeptide repeats